MIVYTREKLQLLLKVDFIRFCIVGGTGFVINFLLLALLPHIFPMPIFIAQLVGSEVALFSNFLLHHHWTYKHKRVQKTVRTLLVQFHASTWPAILGSTAMVSIGVSVLHINKYLALIVSSIIALAWNFVWSKFVIWRGVTKDEIEEITR